MALKEKTHRAVRQKGRNKIKGAYNEILGKIKPPKTSLEIDAFNEKYGKPRVEGKVISRTHVPKERVNQKEKSAKRKNK